MFINALTPVVSFGQLKEPKRNEYTSKQESLASQVREIVNLKESSSNNDRTYLSYLEEDLGLDLLILPNEHRRKIDVYAVDKTSGLKDLFQIFSPETKPKESHLKTYIKFLKEEMNDSFKESVAKIVGGLFIVLLVAFGGSKNLTTKVTDPLKKELSANLTNSLPKDTLQLTTKMFK